MYYYGEYVEQDYEMAFNIFNELAEKYDDPESMKKIADMYYYGYYVGQNYEKAFNIYKDLADNYEEEFAKLSLANMYENGEYVEQDYEKAFDIYIELSEQYNNVLAKYNLGLIYFHLKNYEEAKKYLKQVINMTKNNTLIKQSEDILNEIQLADLDI